MLYPLSYEGGAGTKRGRKTLCVGSTGSCGCIVGAGAAGAPPFKGGAGADRAVPLVSGRGDAACASPLSAFRRLGR